MNFNIFFHQHVKELKGVADLSPSDSPQRWSISLDYTSTSDGEFLRMYAYDVAVITEWFHRYAFDIPHISVLPYNNNVYYNTLYHHTNEPFIDTLTHHLSFK